MRIGFGYDVHKLVEDRPLILGGINIPFEKGLLGHSDADVLIHVIMDALLGAAGLGDIGKHFPDTELEFKDISSMVLLKKVKELIDNNGYRVNNIDATIVAQKPKLASYIPLMVENISKTIHIEETRINIKATTTEGLGFAGQGQGIAGYAVCTLKEVRE
ncbi:MAG: 2-C-methyl-D-erythritol 2,4-cyclodiphosphate synthase [Clostridia bacterium]|nr:2-C-methyl-D-erythritol 2,4-cyclodiphosphate synthase [Clostridia bacterium]